MISVHENVSAHTNRRLSETLDSKTALFSSTNFGEVYLFKIYYGVQEPNGNVTWGSGIHEDIITASVLALISAVNRLDQ